MRYIQTLALAISLIVLFSCNNSSNIINENIAKKELVNSEKAYIEQGKQIALEAKGVLGKNLLQSLKEKGTQGAMLFCSDKAIFLTDSISKALNVNIKRVSDKNRNPLNSPSDIELEYMNQVKDIISKGEKPRPQVFEEDNKIIGYFPIMTNAMCLQCHGQKDVDILPNVMLQIDSLYPDDKATGYKENQLRGIWVIEMMK